MKFNRIFEVRLEQEGTPPSPCSSLFLRPAGSDPSGVEALRRHRLLVRQFESGIFILASLGAGNEPIIDVKNLRLCFEFLVNDPKILYKLDLDGIQEYSNPAFTNQIGTNELVLQERTTEYSLPQGVVAWVEIHSIQPSWASNPPRFVILFKNREVRWVYYIITKRTTTSLRIEDEDTVGNPRIEFICESLPDNNIKDALGDSLRATYPDRVIYRLSSNRAPPNTGQSLLGLNLWMDDTKVMANLPPPPAHQLMSLSAPPMSAATQAIYRVLSF